MSNTGKSIIAIVFGFVAIVALSVGADLIMHTTGVFPKTGREMTTNMFLLATGYRVLISIFGCYLTARLAPSKPMNHALLLGVIGLIFCSMGIAATRSNPELGPMWYPVALLLVTLPCAWVGGRLGERKPDLSKAEGV